MPTDIYAGLGSNVDAARHLSRAIQSLRHRHGRVEVSAIYRNPAVGFAGDDFLNLVVRLRFDRSAHDLERSFSTMEHAAGRRQYRIETTPRPINRTLDVDLLLFGSMVDPELGLPRSDILRYAFVLRPLAELAPELVHPLTGRTMASHWRDIAAQSPPMHRTRF